MVPHQALILGRAPGLVGVGDAPGPNHHQEAESGFPKVLRALTKAECGSAFVYWQPEKGLLWLGSDRYGLKPFYYYHHKGELAFSTDLHRLVQTSKHKFSVNYNALSQFLCLRHPFGDETLFRGIRRLPQGELLRYSAAEGKLQFVPFFKYLSLQPDPGVTFEQVLAEGPDRFTAALERQLSGASKVPGEPLPRFDGLGGDACLGGSEITSQFWEFWQKEQYKPLEKIYFQWYKTRFESLLRPEYHREIKALARKRVVAEIDRVKGNPNGLIYLGLRNFTRRAISLSTFGILGHNRPIRTPFLDHAFFEWSLTIPVLLKIQDNVYSYLFQNYTKETSTIPNTHQPSDGSHYFQKSPQLWRKHPNRVYMAKMIKRLSSFLPKFIAPDLTDRLKKGKIHGTQRDALFALTDLAYWFITYQDHLKIKGWMK